jgi:guanylate kinase
MTKGNLIIVTAPSGAGKSSLVHHALTSLEKLCYSVSYTTRPPRGSEQDGIDYHFVPVSEFLAIRDRGEFLEYAEVHGNFYGTLKSATERLLESGNDVIFDIDVQGAAQIVRQIPEAVTVFILPPSRSVLEARLRLRSMNTEAELKRRLQNAEQEVRRCEEFTYVIVNDDLKNACSALESIIIAERQRGNRQNRTIKEIISTFGG